MVKLNSFLNIKKFIFVLDSSNYFINKLINKNTNDTITFIHLEYIEDCYDIENNIIFIANSSEDIIDFFLLKEKNKDIILIISNYYLVGKLRRSSEIKFYELNDVIENFNEIIR